MTRIPLSASLLRIARFCVLVSVSSVTGAAEHVRHSVHIEGNGGPAVVFSNGLGDTLDTWKSVQTSIASQCVRTVTYNRAGYPGSDAATGSRDAATIVTELRDELQRRGIAPPYVLVGHSLG